MTIHFTPGKLEEDERQAILEEVYQQAKGAATAAVTAVVEMPGSRGKRQVGTREGSGTSYRRTAASD